MERRWTISLQFIVFAFSLQFVGLFAQSARNPVSTGSRTESVTHTIFHGSGNLYGTASRTDGVNGLAPDPMEAIMRSDRALFPWKYEIVATVLWVGEEASEQNYSSFTCHVNQYHENTSQSPAEAHTARCTTGTVGSTSATEENGIVLFSGICGGTCSKQQ